MHERIDHDIADKEYPVFRATLFDQMLLCFSRRCEHRVRNTVGDNTVDLLGHVAVKAS
jgi:hypothetical protein